MDEKRESTTLHAGHAVALGAEETLAAVFTRILRSVRQHLGMDVAFISEIAQGRRYFRYLDARRPDWPFHVGASDPCLESYCQKVAEGALPGVLHDAATHPVAAALEATRAFPIGAHLSVPIRLSDGRVFGTFCCFSARPDHALDARDLDVMKVFADVVADQVEDDLARRDRRSDAAERVQAILGADGPRIVYQPIVEVGSSRVLGFEALSRFPATTPARGPDVWFAEAASVGLGVELELRAIGNALRGLQALPAPVYLSLNASPAVIVGGGLGEELRHRPLDRIVVEVTEHEAVDQYDQLVEAIRPLQARGLRLAIDDAGAGYASFRHILNLAPHTIKLDVSITRGIDGDRSRRALAAAFTRFAAETECEVVAEGVETAAELAALFELGVREAQGYYLGRPMPLEEAVARCRDGNCRR